MATDAASSTMPAPRRRPIAPAALLALGLLGLAVIWFMPEHILDIGEKRMFSVLLSALVALLLFAWFMLFSGAKLATRGLALLIALAAVGAAIGSVRRVEFTGGMQPIIDWRWNADRNAVLEAHRATAPKASGELAVAKAGPLDVLDYRGSRRDGIVDGPALARSWSEQGPKKVWRQPVGGGYSAFVVIGPLAITIEQRRDREAIVAYDADTGAERWVHDYPALFSETLGGDGPRATPTISGDRVYALGATGILSCVELATGRPVWAVNILEENHSGNLDWAMAGSPLVDDNFVVVNPGTQKGNDQSRAVVAYDRETGKRLRASGTGQAGYSSPMLATLAGVRQVLMFEGKALVSYEAANGEPLWNSEWISEYDVNAVQPVLLPDDHVFITSAAGAALLKVTNADGKWNAEQIWKNRQLKGGYSCPIAYGDHVYGLDNGIMVCLNLKDGKRLWKGGRYGAGQMLLTGDLLVVLSEQGELALVEATPEKYNELGRFQAIEGRTWNNPTLRDGRIFIRNHLEMAAYDLPLAPAETSASP